MLESVTSGLGATGKTTASVSERIERARAAMQDFAQADQDAVDMAVRGLAWSVYKPENARLLAEMAVRDTGMGNVESKVVKNTRKTFGTLRDLLRAKTRGIIESNPELGLVKYGKPVGVVGAVCPSTNPAATPVNKAMMAIKGGNAVIIAPSPAGYGTTAKTTLMMRHELYRAGFPEDLVQVLDPPVNKEATQELLNGVDLAVVTGSQNNVQRAMRSGTVSIGVGPGNVPVVIDSSADLKLAAERIAASKTFDNATSCSSENSIVLLDEIYEPAMKELVAAGGWRCSQVERDLVAKSHWIEGKLNRNVLAKDPDIAAREFGLPDEAASKRFFLVEEKCVGGTNGFADEKLSLVLTVYRAKDFGDAVTIVRDILEVRGKGHSVGIHTECMENARILAESADVVRILVNQAHTFGNGGSFENCLPFTLSMGGGTWAGNTISENLNVRHFINVTHLVTAIPEDRPSESELFGPYWKRVGQN